MSFSDTLAMTKLIIKEIPFFEIDSMRYKKMHFPVIHLNSPINISLINVLHVISLTSKIRF